ncbi:hypothetical protein DFH09DRAFT_1099753 [Mycena vulgaris]|nr:hypothetical protein DFH09DRAFT_1099753 [Mycena vulgaris]
MAETVELVVWPHRNAKPKAYAGGRVPEAEVRIAWKIQDNGLQGQMMMVTYKHLKSGNLVLMKANFWRMSGNSLIEGNIPGKTEWGPVIQPQLSPGFKGDHGQTQGPMTEWELIKTGLSQGASGRSSRDRGQKGRVGRQAEKKKYISPKSTKFYLSRNKMWEGRVKLQLPVAPTSRRLSNT